MLMVIICMAMEWAVVDLVTDLATVMDSDVVDAGGSGLSLFYSSAAADGASAEALEVSLEEDSSSRF